MTVPLSTRLFYDRAASSMTSLTAQADRLNLQVSTGKKLLAPSDDSAAYQRLQGLARATTDAKTDSANVTLAQSVLQQADTTLTAITAQLQRASELVLQASNGTASASDRKASATELSQILESIVSLANARDTRGGPLFGGAGDTAAVTQATDGSFGFTTGDAPAIPIGEGQSVLPSSNAAAFLSTGSSDIGAALTAIIAALNAGVSPPTGAVDDLKTVSDRTIATQASIGARAARVDLVAAQMTTSAIDREATRSGLEDVDVTQAITDLQKTITILSATQASFSKLSSLSLFDYLR